MKVEVADKPLTEVEADTVAVGLFEGDELPDDLADAPGAADAKGGFKKTAVLRPERPPRVVVVGLGKRDEFDAERARVAAAVALAQARADESTSIAWPVPSTGASSASGPGAPDGADVPIATGLVEGTILASYRFDRFKSKPDEDDDRVEIESLTLIGDAKLAERVEAARVGAEAANRARELQNLPANVVTPAYLAERAEQLAGEYDAISVEVMGPKLIRDAKMGGIIAVSQGSATEPRLIVIRYDGADGEPIALVGKGVTFDTGGISIKPAQAMHEMKMDMSGAAAVIEGIAAIAELDLPLKLIGVVPATENMPSGSAIKPGDIITQLNGKTVEVNNTDAEGRLILADALAYSVRLGAERIVDIATLTGAVLIALGSTYAGLIANDDAWAAEVEDAAAQSGELAWRLPLHPDYKRLTKGTAADLTNASEKRKASTIYAGSFLEEFVDGKPWVHLDIAGTAWDTEREYYGKGPTGFGVRLLVALAGSLAA